MKMQTAPAVLSAALLAIWAAVTPPRAVAQVAQEADSTAREIHVDLDQAKGPLNRFYNMSVGSDRAIIHLREQDQRDLRFVRDTCGFRYMRFHGLLNEEMHLVKVGPEGKLIYDWTNVDRVYDFLRSIQIRPIVELGFIPTALASGKQTIFYWKGNVTPPKSYEQWGQFIEALTRHLTQRYGNDEVRRWYFEVWNEPNLSGFWTGGQEGYFKLYDASAAAVKRVDAAYRVGGPSTAGGGWIKEMLDHCAQQNEPIDFVSTHVYGTTEGFLDEKGNGHTTLDPNPKAITNWFPHVLGAIHDSKWPSLPLLVTEWGPSYSPRDPVHDSYFCAAYILQKLRRVPAGVVAMSYWTFSDQFEESGPPPSPFHGGFGLLNVQGLTKPAYFAYRFLNQLGDTELACADRNVWACRDDHSVQVLLWDYHQPHQDQPDAPFFARDLPAKPTAPARVMIDHLASGAHTVSITRVGYRHNDVYTAYLDLGSPAGLSGAPSLLSPDVLAKLRRACAAVPETRQMTVAAGAPLTLDLPMNQNDVYFVTITNER